MSDHIPDLDLVAIVVLALLLGVLPAPGVHAKIYRASQERISSTVRIPHIDWLVFSVPD